MYAKHRKKAQNYVFDFGLAIHRTEFAFLDKVRNQIEHTILPVLVFFLRRKRKNEKVTATKIINKN